MWMFWTHLKILILQKKSRCSALLHWTLSPAERTLRPKGKEKEMEEQTLFQTEQGNLLQARAPVGEI